MAIDIVKDTARTVRIVPPDGLVWSSATASIVDPDGTELATPTVTVDTVSTTVSSASYSDVIVVASATGIAVGRHYQLKWDGKSYVVQVVELDSTTVTIDPPPEELPEAAATFVGIELVATIPATATATIGYNYQLQLIDDDNPDREARLVYHVVKTGFPRPLRDSDLRRIVTRQWRGATLGAGDYAAIVEEVEREIRTELRSRGDYAAWHLDPDPFRPLGQKIARRILAEDFGLVPAGVDDVDEYAARLNRSVDASFSRIVMSSLPRDADQNEAPDDTTGRWTITQGR